MYASCRLRVGSFVLKPDQVDDAGAVELLLINLDSVSLKVSAGVRELMRSVPRTSYGVGLSATQYLA